MPFLAHAKMLGIGGPPAGRAGAIWVDVATAEHARRSSPMLREVLRGHAKEGSAHMLVLTRTANQSIMIGHDVVVTVLEIRGDQVRLGIRAPRSIDVHREEVYAALQKANRNAATATGKTLSALGSIPKPPASDKAEKPQQEEGSAEGESTEKA